jgi:hypothetical protein
MRFLALSSARRWIFLRLVIRYQENLMNTTQIETLFLHLLHLLTDTQQQQDSEKHSHFMTFVGVVRHTIFAQQRRRTSDADTANLKVLGAAIPVSYGGELRSARLPSAVIGGDLSPTMRALKYVCGSLFKSYERLVFLSSVKRFVLFSASTSPGVF